MEHPDIAHKRLLLLTDGAVGASLRGLLAQGHLGDWEVVEADSFEHARFLQQFDAFDVILMARAGQCLEDGSRAAWLALAQQTPVVALCDMELDKVPAPVGYSPLHQLPRQLLLAHPTVLAVVLKQAARLSAMRRSLQHCEQLLQDCRRQTGQLVNLLWHSVPGDESSGWLTQRSLLERLEEEVSRSQRYGTPLSLVVGEWADAARQSQDAGDWLGWTSRQVCRVKRHCDVAGQYGPHGFLLLLPQTGGPGAANLCRRLRPALESAEGLPEGMAVASRVRFGSASLSPSTTTAQSLLSQAEEALEHAGQGGG